MTTPHFSDLEYKLYGRQMILPEVGVTGQEKLRESTVAVIGAGGLGSPALLYLAGAGIGRIIIIDDDRVETSNLHRQIIHSHPRVGNLKAESAAETLRALNPAIQVETRITRLTDSNADELLGQAHAVLDGSDNFSTRYATSRACARLGIPHIWGAILGFDAQMSVFWAGYGPVYEDLYPVEPVPGSVPNCATAGVIGALAGIVGTSMVMEATKLLMGVGSPLMGKVGYYSGLEGTWDYIPLVAQPRKTMATLSSQNDLTQAENSTPNVTEDVALITEISWEEHYDQAGEGKTLLLDVRESHEYQALAVPGSQLLPLSEIRVLAGAGELKKAVESLVSAGAGRVDLYCAAGVRSLEAAELFRQAGVERVTSIRGGISEWLMRQ